MRIPAGYLSKKGGRWRQIKLLDLVTLLYNVHAGAQHQDVGFEDAARTQDALTAHLNKKVLVDPSILESALWSCNLLNEHNRYWDPKGRPFEQFVKELIGPDKFNPIYNTIGRKDD